MVATYSIFEEWSYWPVDIPQIVCALFFSLFLNEFLLAVVVFGFFLLLSPKTEFRYVALAGLEFTVYTRLASNLQKTACLCFLNAATQKPESPYPALFPSS